MMRPKVLIITYYWPPTGGSGVQRWAKFVKYLREFGWEPVIYTPSNPEVPALDESLLKDIPDDVEVLKQPIWEPHNLYKAFTGQKKDSKLGAGMASDTSGSGFKQKLSMWVRGNFFIPDARKFWIKPSIKFLTNYLAKNPVEVVVSTGPPHSMHMIAKGVNQNTSIPWIADFRDPWTNIDFVEDLSLTTWGKAAHARMEKAVLKEATEVVAVTPTMAKELGEIGDRNVHVITNGFDKDDFDKDVSSPHKACTLLHIGTMNKARNPDILWLAIKELAKEKEDFAKHFKLKLIGKIDAGIQQSVSEYGLDELVDIVDYVPHSEIITEQKKAHILLLLVNNSPNAYLLYQGKLFEYMAAGKPVLTIGPESGDTRTLLEKLDQSTYTPFGEKDALKIHLSTLFDDYQEGKLKGIDPSLTDPFTRRALTRQMADLLSTLVPPARSS